MALLALRQRITCTPADEALAAAPLMLRLVELHDHTCKWPLGDPLLTGFGFCGHTTVLRLDGRLSSYCAAHAVRSQGRGTETERSAHRAGRAA